MTDTRTERPLWVHAVLVVAVSLLAGGLTSVAQGALPDSMRSFSNSASGWTLITVGVIALRRPRLLAAACLGAVSFVCLVLGYTVVSELRGLTYSPLLWVAVGLLAGPAVGWATSAALGRRPLLSAVGSSFIAGVALADCVYGLTVIRETTSPVYWSVVGLAGVGFLVLVAVRSRLRWTQVAVQLALTIVWVIAGSAGYAVLNGA